MGVCYFYLSHLDQVNTCRVRVCFILFVQWEADSQSCRYMVLTAPFTGTIASRVITRKRVPLMPSEFTGTIMAVALLNRPYREQWQYSNGTTESSGTI